MAIQASPGCTKDKDGKPPPVTEAACWAHVRRKFFDEYKRSSSAPCGSAPLKSNGSPIAKEALARIGELSGIERAIAGKPPSQRQAARMEKAKPKLDALAAWITGVRLSGGAGWNYASRTAA